MMSQLLLPSHKVAMRGIQLQVGVTLQARPARKVWTTMYWRVRTLSSLTMYSAYADTDQKPSLRANFHCRRG